MTENIDFISKLPADIYRSSDGSNNYKIWKLFASQMDELKLIFESLEVLFDISNSAGITLDVISNLLQKERAGYSDSEFQQILSRGFQADSQGGTIEVLNNLCSSVAGDKFLYIEEFGRDELFWLDGSVYLDGRHWLSGNNCNEICYCEIRVADDIDEFSIAQLKYLVNLAKCGGVLISLRNEAGIFL